MRQAQQSGSYLDSIRRRLALIIGSGRINHYTEKRLAQTTWEDGLDNKQKTRIWQHFGFKSTPPKGSYCLGICSGSREKIVVIATDNESEIEILEGESLQYAEKEGKIACFIHLDKNGHIKVQAEKISVSNKNGDELFSLLTECLELISTSKTMTSMGLQPLLPYSASFAKLSKKINTFLEKPDA